MYKCDPNKIATNLIELLRNCLDLQAPVKISQISKRSTTKLSEEARLKLAERDIAHHTYKRNKNQNYLRFKKKLRNKTNQLISKENFARKSAKFNREGLSAKSKWNLAKSKMGQSNFVSPTVMTDGDKIS